MIHIHAHIALLGWLTLVPLTPLAAQAAPQRALSQTQEKDLMNQAKELYRRGRSLFREKQFAKSISWFTRSVDLIQRLERGTQDAGKRKKYKSYRLGFYATLGVAYQWQKLFLQARGYYARCQDAPAPKRIIKLCKKYLPEVEKQLAYINISSRPADAKLKYIIPQQRSVRRSPLPLKRWVTPGKLKLFLKKKGYLSLKRSIILRPGVKFEVLYDLPRESCPTPKAKPVVLATDTVKLGLSTTTALTPAPALSALPQPFQPPMPPWQIALIAGGAAIGAAALVGGTVAVVYGVTNRRYVLNSPLVSR